MKKACNILIYLLALPRGIEPLTKNLEGSCSIILSFTVNYHILLFPKGFFEFNFVDLPSFTLYFGLACWEWCWEE